VCKARRCTAREVKHADEPPIGGRINKPPAPRMVVRRKGARCGGASTPMSLRQGLRRALPRQSCGHANTNRIGVVNQ
jgi:hypothetical protein